MPSTHVNIMCMFELSGVPSDLRVCLFWSVILHVASETEQLRVHVFSLGADPYCCFSLRECICLHVCVSLSQSRKEPLLNQPQGPAPPPLADYTVDMCMFTDLRCFPPPCTLTFMTSFE